MLSCAACGKAGIICADWKKVIQHEKHFYIGCKNPRSGEYLAEQLSETRLNKDRTGKNIKH